MTGDLAPGTAAAPAPPVAPEALADPRSAMTPRFNLFFRGFARRYFSHLEIEPAVAQRLRELEARGSVVYVMRYASRLDYFLFNALFVRQGLRLASFANGIRFWYYRPLAQGLRAWWQGRTLRAADPGEDEEAAERRQARELVGAGRSLFLFLRTERLRSFLGGREAAVEQVRRQRDLLAEVVDVAETGRPVYLVPIALFWRKGPRAARRVLNLAYGAPTRPTDLAKVTGFLIAYRAARHQRGRGDRPHPLRERTASRRGGRDRAQGAALHPALPLPRRARRRGTDAAAAAPRAGDRALRIRRWRRPSSGGSSRSAPRRRRRGPRPSTSSARSPPT